MAGWREWSREAAERTWSGVRAPFRRFWRSSLDRSRRRDLNILYRRLGPRQVAQRDAITGEAHTTSERRSRYEHVCFQRHQSYLDVEKELSRKTVERLSRRSRRLPQCPRLDEKSILEGVQKQELALVALMRRELVNARASYLFQERRLRAFMRTNNLLRGAGRPNVIVGIISIGALWAFELVLNFFYLNASTVNTPAQNIMLVIGTASVNLGLGVCAGLFGLKNIGHVAGHRRGIGWAIVAIAALACGAFHYWLACFRFALDQVHLTPGMAVDYVALAAKLRDALVNLGGHIEAPTVVFGDFFALMVFLGGLAFACLAAAEAYWLIGDRYPGYSDVDKACREAAERDKDVTRQFTDRIHAVTAAAGRHIRRTVELAEQRYNAAVDILNGAIVEAQSYESRATQVEQALNRALYDYREEYAEVYQGEVPEHWIDEIPGLNREGLFDVDHFEAMRETAEADLRSLEDEAERIRIVLVTREMELRAKVKEILDQVQADAVSKELADAKFFGLLEESGQ